MAIVSETSTISQNDLKHEQNHTTLWRLTWGKKKGLGNQLRLQTFWKSLCSLLAWRINNFSVSCGGRHIITVLILLSLILLIYNFAHPASRRFFSLFSTSGPKIYFLHLNTIIVFKNKTIRRTRSVYQGTEWLYLMRVILISSYPYFCFWLELYILRHLQLCENSSSRFPKILEHFGNKTSAPFLVFPLNYSFQIKWWFWNYSYC